jgi:hypothetical protein
MKSSMIMASLVLAAAAGAAQAGTVQVQNNTGVNFGSGGEFRGVAQTGWAGVTGTASDIGAGFRTFCVERNIFFTPGTTYAFQIETVARSGGGGPNPDPISIETAYLYTKFRTMTLSGYRSDTDANRALDAGSLQLALWRLEDEFTAAQFATKATLLAAINDGRWNGLTDDQFSKANAFIADATANASSFFNGNSNNVRALNIFADNNGNGVYDAGTDGDMQSQLTLIPLPTGAALGLAGLSVLAIRRRAAR